MHVCVCLCVLGISGIPRCIHKYVCMHICIHVYVYVYMYIYVHIYNIASSHREYVNLFMHVCLCVRVFWVFPDVYINMYVCIYVYMYMYMYICIYMYVYITSLHPIGNM